MTLGEISTSITFDVKKHGEEKNKSFETPNFYPVDERSQVLVRWGWHCWQPATEWSRCDLVTQYCYVNSVYVNDNQIGTGIVSCLNPKL